MNTKKIAGKNIEETTTLVFKQSDKKIDCITCLKNVDDMIWRFNE